MRRVHLIDHGVVLHVPETLWERLMRALHIRPRGASWRAHRAARSIRRGSGPPLATGREVACWIEERRSRRERRREA